MVEWYGREEIILLILLLNKFEKDSAYGQSVLVIIWSDDVANDYEFFGHQWNYIDLFY